MKLFRLTPAAWLAGSVALTMTTALLATPMNQATQTKPDQPAATQPDSMPNKGGDEAMDEKPEVTTEVKLINPGQAPFAEMRYAPEVGTKQTIEQIQLIDISAMTPMGPQNIVGPKIRMVTEAEVTDVMRNGQWKVAFEYTEVESMDRPGANPMMAQQLAAQMAGMKGSKGEIVLDERGVTQSISMNADAGTDPAMTEGMQTETAHMFLVFPSEPIGRGAQWSITTTINAMGISMKQVDIFTLTSSDDEQAEVNIETAQQGDVDALNESGQAQGEIKSLEGEGTGSATIVFTSPMPVNMIRDVTTRMAAEMAQGGQSFTVEQSFRNQTEIKEVDG